MRGTVGLLDVPVGGRIVVIGSGIISSGVDNRGDVDVDTPPKPFMRLFVKFSDADEVERTSILFPFGKLLST